MAQKKRISSSKSKNKRKRKSRSKVNGGVVFALTVAAILISATVLSYFYVNNSETKVSNIEQNKTNQAKPVEKREEKKSEIKVQEVQSKPSATVSSGQTDKSKADTATAAAPSASTPSVNGTVAGSASKSSGTKETSSQASSSKTSSSQKIATVSSSGEKTIEELPSSRYNIPQAVNKAKVCFVIDDAGLNVSNVKKYTALPFPVTIAVLPRLSHSKDCAYVVRSSGKELILHQPMQAHAYSSGTVPDPGEGAILPDMSSYEIAETIKQNLLEIGPNVKGFNNHEGSLITENSIKMLAILQVAQESGVYFLDSRTTAYSAAPQAALELDMKYIARYAPFLDHEATDRDYMVKQLYKGLDVANKNGYAVIIGHVDKDVKVLPDLLNDVYPYLVKAGYVITTPSKL